MVTDFNFLLVPLDKKRKNRKIKYEMGKSLSYSLENVGLSFSNLSNWEARTLFK